MRRKWYRRPPYRSRFGAATARRSPVLAPPLRRSTMPIGADGDRASAVPLSPGEACFLFGARCAAEGQEEHECGPAKHGAGLAVDGGDGCLIITYHPVPFRLGKGTCTARKSELTVTTFEIHQGVHAPRTWSRSPELTRKHEKSESIRDDELTLEISTRSSEVALIC